MLPESDRKDLAIQALARSTTISDLSARHRVSRKFVYQQAHKAGAALDEVFFSGTPEDDVLFHLTVSKTWLRQVIVALTLICRSSYRGVVEFLRDLLGVPVSIGTVHHVLQSATRQCSSRPPARRVSSTTLKTYRASSWACMMKSSRVHCRCWPVSMPHRLTAISWLWQNIVTPTPGACIYLTLPGKD
jgi:hypothetical protein